MAYSINTKRLPKVFKVAKQYLHWVQNSVFEGNLTKKLNELKFIIEGLIEPNVDSVMFYELSSKYYLEKNHLGIDKS